MVHVLLMFFFRMAWISFGALPCRGGKKLDYSSRLDVVEIARVAWHASFQPLKQEKTCNLAHEQTPLSNDTIDSVLWHREVRRAKDLSATPRTYACIASFYSQLFYVLGKCSMRSPNLMLWILSSPERGRPSLGPTQPPVQCVQEALSLGAEAAVVTLTTLLHLLLRLRMNGTISPLPYMSSQCTRRQLSFYLSSE